MRFERAGVERCGCSSPGGHPFWVNTPSFAAPVKEEQSSETTWLLDGEAHPLCGSS